MHPDVLLNTVSFVNVTKTKTHLAPAVVSTASLIPNKKGNEHRSSEHTFFKCVL